MREDQALRSQMEAMRRDMRRRINEQLYGPTLEDRARAAAHVTFGDITSQFGCHDRSPWQGLQSLIA